MAKGLQIGKIEFYKCSWVTSTQFGSLIPR